ncbi:hypothetical protein SAMN04487770_13843 [Butyrivibrio sp. ob235]|uniref:hypothetical protein n=1 Tax=Butyrivibrio sp. ob235 TaxID=1761780 RepID=UPI0008ACB169|nr:hypothetical protein [Butyrivibrio sp. ob235]SEM42781.1 hypothetical protein SAMN04487770_13843 [Butyrivibrio sp. ob235]
MKLVESQKFLVIRYSTKAQTDLIEKHKEVIKQYGYCWFGKMGTVLSEKLIKTILGEEQPALVLYKKEKSYLCNISEVIQNCPDRAYPHYYDELLQKPSTYIKINIIDEIEDDFIRNSIVVSTQNYVLDTMSHSSLSFLIAEYHESINRNSIANKTDNNLELGQNDCRYRKSGMCTYRSCINFEYECERPSSCAKQKR